MLYVAMGHISNKCVHLRTLNQRIIVRFRTVTYSAFGWRPSCDNNDLAGLVLLKNAVKGDEVISKVRARTLAFLWLFLTAFAPTAVSAQSSPDEGGPPPNQGSISARLQTAFDKTGDIGIVYHLARISFASGNYEAASSWLALMADTGWKMGLDPVDFSNNAAPDALLTQISDLNAAAAPSRRTSAGIAVLDDPRLVPESIAYDPEAQTLYAGSLAAPRLVQKNVNVRSIAKQDAEVILPDDADWGVMYGIKFNAERGDLWLLNNRRDSDGMHGNLSVIDRTGTLVKSYRFIGEPAIELNDLCFSQGYVYVTDSTASRIYRGSLSADALEVFYSDSDISFPNGIACNDRSDAVYVADFRGVSLIRPGVTVRHQRLDVGEGFSLGGIDGMYLWDGHLVGVQNYLGVPKIVVADPRNLQTMETISFFDVNHPDFRIPTTGFVAGDCLFYIANSSLDALGRDGAIDPAGLQPEAAKILGLNLREGSGSCSL